MSIREFFIIKLKEKGYSDEDLTRLFGRMKIGLLNRQIDLDDEIQLDNAEQLMKIVTVFIECIHHIVSGQDQINNQ